jgi:hypothetical protein
LRRHRHDADVGFFEGIEDERWCSAHRAWSEVFQKEWSAECFALSECGFKRSGDGAAGFVRNERNGFARFYGEARFNGVDGAWHQLGLRRAEGSRHLFILAQLDCNLRWDVCTGTSFAGAT